MTPLLWLGLALGGVLVATAVAARRFGQPEPILLMLVGIGIALTPGAPRVHIHPELVLLLALPPLLYSSGVGMSWRGFRANLRPILLLAVGCVLFTAVAVAALAHYAFGLPWAVGFVLGAVVSPPDAIAPMAIARRFAIPNRILTVLEGESLVNDATALVLFSFSLAAVGGAAVSLPKAAATFAAIAVGEVAWGALVGAATLRLRKWAADPQAEIALALLTPFVAFWPPHFSGGSGVVAAVTAGLWVSWNGPRFISPETRLQGFFVWNFVVYAIEGVVFLLTGLQARTVLDGLSFGADERLIQAGLAVSAAVVLVRFLWVYPATYLPRLIVSPGRRDPLPNWRGIFLVGFTGLRGVVSLAAALSIPLTTESGAAFPERRLILAVTFCVILVTLLGQGLTLPFVIRGLGLEADGRREAADAKRRELAARLEGVDAALARLDAADGEGAPRPLTEPLRKANATRRAQLERTADEASPGSPTADTAALTLKLLDAERTRLDAVYRRGDLDDAARRRLERELDLEEARARHAAESANIDALIDPAAD